MLSQDPRLNACLSARPPAIAKRADRPYQFGAIRKSADESCGRASRAAARSETVEEEERAKAGAVQSVDRALLLLEALGEDEEGYRLTDLAFRTGLSPSTAHRLLTTLEKRRFVEFDQSDACGTSAASPSRSVRPSCGGAISSRRRCRSCGGCAT